jgi:hypothetical protein
MMKTTPNLDMKRIRRLQRQYWTAFKHASLHGGEERDDDDLLSRFTDKENDTALYIGWYDYAQAVNVLPIEAQAYLIWYLAMNIEKLDAQHSQEPYEIEFPNIRTMSRVDQKRMLNDSIIRARGKTEVMSNLKTERRPLVLDWP